MKLAKYTLPILMVTMAACGSDKSTGPGGGKLSSAERQALQTLMAKPEFVSAVLGTSPAAAQGAMMLPFAAASLNSIGTFSVGGSASTNVAVGSGIRPQVSAGQSFRAFGGQFSVKVNNQSMVWTGIIALNNLSNPTDMLTAGVISNTTTAPKSIASTNMNGTTAYGSYIKWNGQTATSYTSTSGKIEFTNINGSGAAGCPGVPANHPILKVCKYGNGSVAGKFNFDAKQINGAATVNVPETTVNIPAVIMQMEIAY